MILPRRQIGTTNRRPHGDRRSQASALPKRTQVRTQSKTQFGTETSQAHGQNILILRISAVLLGNQRLIGRDDRIRTCDPHTPSVMRYQAALRPDRQVALGNAPLARGGGRCKSCSPAQARAQSVEEPRLPYAALPPGLRRGTMTPTRAAARSRRRNLPPAPTAWPRQSPSETPPCARSCHAPPAHRHRASVR
jgi:hypothetical protein